MADEFKASLIAHAQLCLDRAPKAATEAATQQYLILPFVQLLGYDPLDPDEVIPEAHASFSDKFKNRVDFAICQAGQPVIAIECKKVGTLVEANRGELKGYFNAVPTVKLGILTDGLVYRLYTDTGLENMMDDIPFAVVDLSDVAREQIDQTALKALGKLRKGTFDPAYVGADARRRIYTSQYADALDPLLANPDERFVRTLMDVAGIEGRRTTMVEEHAPIVRDAGEMLLDRKILERVGFADRKDLVKMRPDTAPAPSIPVGEPEPAGTGESGVVTTETELQVYDYVRTRLPFLIAGDETLYSHSSTFARWIATRCSACSTSRSGKAACSTSARAAARASASSSRARAGGWIETDSLSDIDQQLVAVYRQRVAEMG